MERRIINPWTWQDALGYVQAHEVTGVQSTLYCAGQTSVGADGGPLHKGDMAAQIGQALDNLETVLKESGYELSDVVRMNFYTTDVDGFMVAAAGAMGRIAESKARFSSTLLGVARLAFPPLMVEIEATAVK